MVQLIKIHKWAILLAFLVGVIVAFPQLYFSYDNSETYQGIYVSSTDNEYSYLNRVQEVRDGHFSLGSPVFKEGKNDPYIQSPGGEILVAYLGKIFFLDLNGTILLSRFLFSFLGFLAIYSFVFLITKEKLTASAAAITVILARFILSRGGLFALLRGESPVDQFLDLYRPIQPQVSFLFFFAFLVFFWLFFERKQWRWGIISALILGISFYIYPYTWSFLCAFLGALFLILLFRKKKQEARRIFFLALAGIIIAIPYFINVYRLNLYPSLEEISYRFRLVETHQPILGFLVPTLFVVFLIFFPKQWKERFIFCLALLIAPFIVLNQQIITGKELSSGHYHWFYHQPLTIIFLIIILLYWVKFWQARLSANREKPGPLKKINAVKVLAFLIIGFSIYTGVIIQASSYGKSEEKILSDQRYAKVVQWFNLNAQKDEVVLADRYQSDILSIYTSLNQFYATHSFIYLSATNERTLSSLFLLYRLDGVSGPESENLFLGEERGVLSVRVYGTYYKNIAGTASAIPDEILLSFAEKYRNFLLIPLDKIFEIYDIKYIAWDKINHPRWQLDQYPFLTKVYEEGDFAIYIYNR